MKHKSFDKEDYFNFLYDMAFENDDYVGLARILHSIEYRWTIRMDENRVGDGLEIRKYYLSDDLGYMPEDMDVNDPYIFSDFVSVFEVFVGFANRLCRDFLDDYEVFDLIYMFCQNLGILFENWEVDKKERSIRKTVRNFMLREEKCKNIWGFGTKYDDFNDLDLWKQGMRWINEIN